VYFTEPNRTCRPEMVVVPLAMIGRLTTSTTLTSPGTLGVDVKTMWKFTRLATSFH
jgi:hypothetical protein